MKRNTVWIPAAAVVLGMLTVFPTVCRADESPQEPEVTGAENLVKERGAFRETWVLPGADFSRYTKIYPWQAVFQFREAEEARRTGLTSDLMKGGGPYAVRDESKEKFAAIVEREVVRELGNSKHFEVVDQVGPQTLIVRPAMLDIVSNVPPSFTGTTKVYLSAVGEATILFDVIDAETGVIQARFGDRRRIQPPGRRHEVSQIPANSVTVWADVERWARTVSQDLRRALDKARR